MPEVSYEVLVLILTPILLIISGVFAFLYSRYNGVSNDVEELREDFEDIKTFLGYEVESGIDSISDGALDELGVKASKGEEARKEVTSLKETLEEIREDLKEGRNSIHSRIEAMEDDMEELEENIDKHIKDSEESYKDSQSDKESDSS